ncbi:penicillin-binding protein activator [Simiduia sp. 21SJ11W-1]|uniref:penicillin-binding protein activator n=1 Tax=Simiduia sp. 21SJ11W-1 TaxID=2909669 RepID=UPI00209D1EA5|nr:penicillin-binding protein activator [Simiduia sp. 21SJ11W-1]UTA48856.1 penicillin-binding protein activator [Simiduia sp. 21SJ11W-1]
MATGLLCLWLAACSAPVKKTEVDTAQALPSYSMESVQTLLLQARAALSPEKEQLLIQSAEQLQHLGDADWARNLLGSIDTSRLAPEDLWHYTTLYSNLLLAQEANFLAQEVLMNPKLTEQWELMPKDTYISLRSQRAALLATLGETELAVQEYIALDHAGLAPEQRQQNQDALWQTLMDQPRTHLQQLARNSGNLELQGWYQLAALSKNNQHQLESQLRSVDDWLMRWPGHPAASRLPRDLQLLQQLIAEKPQHVALLLPVSGKLGRAGRAIRDGFFAAHYQSLQAGSPAGRISLYDTNLGDIQTLYQQAVADGAQLIIGPLDKDKVAELALLPVLPVPTLALNRIEQPAGLLPTQNLMQFGLAAEDEARQAARRAWLEGHRLAMVIAVDASWADRSAVAFISEWQALGGTVVEYAKFTGKADYSKIVQRGLLIDHSNQRAANVRNILGRAMEFEPRRRQDVDMIFITALPNQARQLKPTLKFHQASNIPVFATSHVYAGEENPKLDSDLNGIRFSTLPWIFNEQSEEKRAIERFSHDPSFNRLYAMGVDAYHLYPRLRQLREIPNATVFGATGNLQLTPEGHIVREQMWAYIRRGLAQPLPMVISNEAELSDS